MALNYIWVGFFIIAFLCSLFEFFFNHNTAIFQEIITALFDRAKTGFELSLGLSGMMTLWLGIMKIGEKAGAVDLLSKAVSPLFTRLFPEIPKNHSSMGSMMMNFSANMLGLDNAATPLGLKAMKELQSLNPNKDTASNAQIMFLVLNSSGLTIIPVSILALRMSSGSVNPTDVFVPILMATICSTLVGLIATALFQRINLLQPVVLAYLFAVIAFVGGIGYYVNGKSQAEIEVFTSLFSNLLLFGVIISFIVMGLLSKINIYEAFIDGAKEGFNVAITIVPYLVAMLCAVGVFTASGAMEILLSGVRCLVDLLGMDNRFVDGLPTAFMKPLSGGGARGLMAESWKIHGVDSFVGKLTSIIQGSTETTFYILAVYFGSVGIKKTRHAVSAGLIAEVAGIVAAIAIAYMFFG
ncbi:MAG: hypothetical protein C4K58_07375 [Flavobacteriaceae bacterium]|nr:MAG: hypothetical protein C4K58_07375 [Flavobacteriaceae bacterium]